MIGFSEFRTLWYEKTKDIKDKSERALAIRELIRKEYFSDRKSGGSGITNNLFKSIKDFLSLVLAICPQAP